MEEPLSAEQAADLLFYENPKLQPELTPMWFAFDVFATHALPNYGEELVLGELEGFGLSQPAIQKILASANKFARNQESLIAEIGPKQVEIQRIARDARAAGLEKEAVGRAFRERDSNFFQNFSPRSKTHLDELFAAVDRNPAVELTAPALATLRDRLDETDWDAFRNYLRRMVVPRMGPTVEYSESE